ncbi:MAG: VCBS repeat-containing protein, partial [Planctomycetaceae bacterium]|nr:VCBS repeat-containing protein [Planctomycetaceae bacterium]
VFDDTDADGFQDVGEDDLEGITVFADLNMNGLVDQFEPFSVSDSNGEFTLVGVQPQRLSFIRQSLDANRTATAPIGVQFAPGPTPVLTQATGARSASVTDSVIAVDLDFDISNSPDLVVINPHVGNQVQVYLNNALTGEVTLAHTLTLSDEAVAVRVGDVTFDGAPDIVVGLENGSLDVFVFNFGGGFSPAMNVAGVANLSSLELIDFDADGDLDVLLTSTSSGDLTRLENDDGDFIPLSSIIVPSADSGGDIVAGFFNLDGLMDFAFVDFETNKVHIGLQQVAGGFNFAAVSVGQGPISIAAGDADSDGDMDLAITNVTDKSVQLLRNNGTGAFTAGTARTFTDTPGSVAIGGSELTPQKYLGVSFTNSNFGSVVPVQLGSGTLGTPQPILVGGPQDSIALADLNNDGVDDLIASRLNGTVALLENRTGPFDGTYLAFPRAGDELTGFVFGSTGIGSEATITIDGNDLKITDTGAAADQLTVRTDGTSVFISSAGTLLTSISGATGNGTSLVTVPLSQFTGGIFFDTLVGNDQLTIDFSTGNFSRQIQYLGGDPTSGSGDKLVLEGGSFASATYNFTNASDGTINLTGNALITYSGLEPILSTINSANVTLNFAGGSETITVSHFMPGLTTVDSTLGEQLSFPNPATSLTINAGSGDDSIIVSGFAMRNGGFKASLAVDGQAGDDFILL